MYSQCPECLTRFRVTAAALRAAHGTVRCGRCGSAFDALPRLSDTLHDADADAGPAVPGDLLGATGIGAATAAGVLGAAGQGDVPEFQLSADDIENVFIDVRDWHAKFGADASPGDRAGQRGGTSTAELEQLLAPEFADPDDEAAPTSDSKVWVHEPEAVEDITLEGERIQIEGFAGFEEDFLEREIQREIEEQHLAEITGSQRVLATTAPPTDEEGVVDDAVPLDEIAPLHDLDSTDQYEILTDAPESALIDDDGAAIGATAEASVASAVGSDAASTAGPTVAAGDEAPAADQGSVPALPEAVATTAAGLAVAASISVAAREGSTADDSRLPPPRPAAPWRRVAEPEAGEITADDHEPDPQLAEDLAEAARARRLNWAWGVGAALLALVLTTQVVHHFRLQLASDATVGSTLRQVYARIGQPLPPEWNLGAFELQQWGANEAAPTSAGALTVRASLRNGATFAQPMPLLRLELEDRFGGTVARRDFDAREYLSNPAQANRLLAAGTATEAELAIVDAPADAVGYRLDVCLPAGNQGVRCAQDARTAETGQLPR